MCWVAFFEYLETQKMWFSSNCCFNFEQIKSLRLCEVFSCLIIVWSHFFSWSKIAWTIQLPSPLVIGWLEENLKPKDFARSLPSVIGSDTGGVDEGFGWGTGEGIGILDVLLGDDILISKL